MYTLGQQKFEPLAVASLAALALGVAALSLAVPALMPWSFLVLMGAALLTYWAIRWEITLLAWLWVLCHGLLDWPEWRVEVTGFFNMTASRFIYLAAVAGFGLHFLFHRQRIRFDRGLPWVMLALTGYCALSASSSGWLAQTEAVKTAPYFRFLGAMVFPFLMFLLIYSVMRDERQIRWPLVLLSAYGWYALYVGYLQYAAIMGADGARQFLWPPYVNDPTYGIHFDRARGAFWSGSEQAILLTLVFYADLYLLRLVRGPYRGAMIVQVLLIPPAIFFTGMRSGYLGFLLCGAVWCLAAGRRRFGAGKLALAALALLVAVVAFWGNLTQTARETGGLAQRGPVEARLVLARQTWEIFKDHPLTGVGFGHFVDAQYRLPRDPTSLGALSTGLVVEHNLFLSMAAETGLIGLAGIVAVFVLIYRQSRQLYDKIPETAEGWLSRPLVVLFWVAMVNYLTDAMFRDTYADIFANALFWCFAGLVAGFNRLLEPQPLDLPAHAAAPEG